MQQSEERVRQFLQIVRADEPAIAAMLDDLFNPLSVASDDGSGGRHRFQIDAAQPLVFAGKREQGGAPHGFRHLSSTLASQKAHLFPDFQCLRQATQT
ncbi:MAG TPA: hypothetical protein VK641_07205 [Terriglobales bacterium]|nr:hypothetical protein [Terriglobales bacterium]